MRNPIPTEERAVREPAPVAQDYTAGTREPGLRPGLSAVSPLRGPRYAGPARRWLDWVNLLLGAWFFVAAWILTNAVGAGSYSAVIWNNWIAGGVVVLASLWALAVPRDVTPEWINLFAGIWIFISPWVLGFSAYARVNWDAWIVGAVVFFVALWALSLINTRFGWRRAAL